MVKTWAWGVLALLLGGSLFSPKAIAVDEETLLLLTDPLEIQYLNLPEEQQRLFEQGVVTPDTISQTGLTVPSLWWAQQQYGGTLLEYWFAFSGEDGTPPRVDLLVNQQAWNNTDYLAQYSFLLRFGRVSEDFGYSTRVFNGRGELLGAYICPTDAATCLIFLAPATPNALLNPSVPLMNPTIAR
ncbi:hypothetical protein [Leptolyngbya ohadii]|uniref:hypothetical protein n=1 Tax=Leptolyngbya ohadii TaxID=1962290 RepID=UPI000B59EF6B|nr:hypothetical protein [Leptolyngbya ohadii]